MDREYEIFSIAEKDFNNHCPYCGHDQVEDAGGRFGSKAGGESKEPSKPLSMVWKCRGCNKLFNLFKLSSFSKWGSSTGGDDRPH